MISLLVSFAVLTVGYLIYSRVAERIFAPDDRKTPAIAENGLLYPDCTRVPEVCYQGTDVIVVK